VDKRSLRQGEVSQRSRQKELKERGRKRRMRKSRWWRRRRWRGKGNCKACKNIMCPSRKIPKKATHKKPKSNTKNALMSAT
jgi:hypothetical protein